MEYGKEYRRQSDCRGGDMRNSCRMPSRQPRMEMPDSPSCGCDDCTVEKLHGFKLAMVYSPNQEWENIYDCAEALQNGTLFADLNFPWYASCCAGGAVNKNKGGCGND